MWPNKDWFGNVSDGPKPVLYQRLQLQFYVFLMKGAMEARNM